MKTNILNCKHTYDEVYNSFCYQNCLRQILESYNVDNAEYYLNRTLSMKLEKGDILDLKISFDDHARSLLPEYENKVRRYLPVGRTKEEVFEENLEKIRKGEPIVAGVDSYYLSYLPYYLKSHGRHTVIMAGYDESNEKIHVLDWMAPWFYEGFVDKNEFLDSRDSGNENDGGIYSGLAIENNWAELDLNGWNATTKELILQNMELSYHQYYKETSGDFYTGVQALYVINEKVKSLEEFDDDTQKNFIDLLHKRLYLVNRRRDFFRYFLVSAHRDTDVSEIKDAAAAAEDIFLQWDTYLYKLIKASCRRKPGYTEKLTSAMDELIKKEEDFSKILLNLISILK